MAANLATVPNKAWLDFDRVLSPLTTANGAELSPKEDRFITAYLRTGEVGPSAEVAGYIPGPNIKRPKAWFTRIGNRLLRDKRIQDECRYRAKQAQDATIADVTEILQYYTKVMRNEEKDQFGLDASLADRTTAAKLLLAKLDSMTAEKHRNTTTGESSNVLKIVLDRGNEPAVVDAEFKEVDDG